MSEKTPAIGAKPEKAETKEGSDCSHEQKEGASEKTMRAAAAAGVDETSGAEEDEGNCPNDCTQAGTERVLSGNDDGDRWNAEKQSCGERAGEEIAGALD